MNFWILQSNPVRFPITDEIRSRFSSRQLPPPYERVSYWQVQRIPLEMSPGDTAFVWKSNGREEGTRGIYAKAMILSLPPHTEPLTPNSIDAVLRQNGSYLDWIHPEEEGNKDEWETVIIRYTESLLDTPLKADAMKKVPELGNLPIVTCPRRILYSLTFKQGEAIEREIERGKASPRQSPAPAAMKSSLTHNGLVNKLREIGESMGRTVESSYQLKYGQNRFIFDQVWRSPTSITPSHVFEVELSGNSAAALVRLENAKGLWRECEVYLLVEKQEMDAAMKWVPNSLRDVVHLLPVEELPHWSGSP